MRLAQLVGLLAIAIAQLPISAASASANDEGFFARSAQPIWNRIAGTGSKGKLLLRAPDRSSQVAVKYRDFEPVVLELSGRMGRARVPIGVGVGSELLWAPDSKAFAVTTSNDGANGIYRTLVVGANNRRVIVHDITNLVRGKFGHPVKCWFGEYPNVAAVKWLDRSSRLIVAAEVVHHSNCDSFGTFRAYEIDWRRMRILRTFNQLEAKRLFGAALGVELRSAPDECIREPKRCWVAANHPRGRR